MAEKIREKKLIIDKIIAIEEKMFLNVRTREPSLCQSMIKTFRAMRRMSFSVLAGDTLNSYLNDLEEAERRKRNLVAEKYARMDNLIPVINNNSVIHKIVRIEMEWMYDLHNLYPYSVQCDDKFKIYETGELETYSDRTLELYYRDLLKAYGNGVNLCAKRYLNLYKELGYASLEEVEKAARLKMEGGDMANNLLRKDEENFLVSIDEEKKKITRMYKKLLDDYLQESAKLKKEKVEASLNIQ